LVINIKNSATCFGSLSFYQDGFLVLINQYVLCLLTDNYYVIAKQNRMAPRKNKFSINLLIFQYDIKWDKIQRKCAKSLALQR